MKKYLYIEEDGETKASELVLEDLSDVDIVNPVTGEIITKTATTWQNKPNSPAVVDGGFFA